MKTAGYYPKIPRRCQKLFYLFSELIRLACYLVI